MISEHHTPVLRHLSTIKRQRVQIDTLEETIRQLKAELAKPNTCFPLDWGLTPAHCRILSAFGHSPFLTNARLFQVAALNLAADPDNLVKVHICNLRKKVAPFGVQIVNRFGVGYEMPEESRAIVKAAMVQA